MRIKRVLIFVLVVIIVLFTACTEKEQATHEPMAVWIIGDSLAAKSREHSGWGAALQYYIKSDIVVKNAAMGGASASSYLEQSAYEMVMENVNEGDYVIIMLGHNDASHMTGSTDPYMDSDTEGSYKNLLKNQYIIPLLDKGVYPVLATSVACPNFYNGKMQELGYYDHTEAMRALYEECYSQGLEVLLIDTYTITKEHYNQIGEQNALAFHMYDRIHYNKDGAIYGAGVIAEQLKEQKVPGFEDIRSETEVYEFIEEN